MIRPKRAICGTLLTALSACSAATTPVVSSPISFSPNPGSLVSGVCSSQATVIQVERRPSTLVAMSARFEDSAGNAAEFSLNAEELSALVDSLEVPGSSSAELPLQFDLGAQGMTLPAEGTIVLTGVSINSVTSFVGALTCGGI